MQCNKRGGILPSPPTSGVNCTSSKTYAHILPISHLRPSYHAKLSQLQVLSILESPPDSTLLIDVREPHEFEANTIPTALNIPVSTQPDALMLSEEEFMDRFGWAKPPINHEVIFFCKAGVRSRAAAQLAKHAG